MTRRGKGEGSIRLRADGRWEATLTLPSTGKRRRRSLFGKTRIEVSKKLRDAQKRQDDNLPLLGDKLLVGAYLSSWLEGKQGDLRPETWRRYNTLCRLHLGPALGRRVLSKLQPADLRAAYASIGRRVSATTVAHCHGVLHVALRDAERLGLVGRNVASLVTPPRRSTGEQRHLGPEDARQLLEAARGHPLEAFFVLALTSGLRLGELQALRWSDIDTERQRVQVSRTLTTVRGGEPLFGQPKTQKSRRTVWLSATACEALETHRLNQPSQRQLAGAAWKEYGLAFTNALGKPLDNSHVLSRGLHPLLDKAGLPRMRFHDLRHTAATVLLSQGVPVKVVSELLGHSDISTTLRIYAHVIEGAQEQAVSVMDKLFHG